MLDFNQVPKVANQISDLLNVLIDDALVLNRMKQPVRNYLGASQLGAECPRALQYEYNNTPKDAGKEFNGQTLRIFALGHLFEELAISWLKSAGFDLRVREENNRQFGFKAANGKIAGHVDGIIYGAPDSLHMQVPALLEVKSMNSKSWKDTVKKGLVLSKPIYAAQIAMYQAYMEESIPGISVNPALLTAINKDTAEIYHELIPFDKELAEKVTNKAFEIINASDSGTILPRLFATREFLTCRSCSWQDGCWSEIQ